MEKFETHNKSLGLQKILDFLYLTSHLFDPPLSERLDLKEYAKKLTDKAEIIYISYKNDIIGLLAYYTGEENEDEKYGYITFLCVLPVHSKKGVGRQLVFECMSKLKKTGRRRLYLEVDKCNINGIRFYEKYDFCRIRAKDTSYIYSREL